MEAEVTPWWEDNVGGVLCHAMACIERAHFYRYIVIGGKEFRQLACVRHADQENNFCPHCGHYLASKTTCPKCKRDKEGHVNAD